MIMGIKPDAPVLSPGHYRDMRDIAPTLAVLLGVQLPQARGKALLK